MLRVSRVSGVSGVLRVSRVSGVSRVLREFRANFASFEFRVSSEVRERVADLALTVLLSR